MLSIQEKKSCEKGPKNFFSVYEKKESVLLSFPREVFNDAALWR